MPNKDKVFLKLYMVHSMLISWKTHLEITNPGVFVYSEEAKNRRWKILTNLIKNPF